MFGKTQEKIEKAEKRPVRVVPTARSFLQPPRDLSKSVIVVREEADISAF